MSASRALVLGELISYILCSLAQYKMFEKAKSRAGKHSFRFTTNIFTIKLRGKLLSF